MLVKFVIGELLETEFTCQLHPKLFSFNSFNIYDTGFAIIVLF